MIGLNIYKVSNHTLIYVNALRYNVVSLPFLKQTNTADMLDLAVDYIKDLQKQAQVFQKFNISPISIYIFILFVIINYYLINFLLTHAYIYIYTCIEASRLSSKVYVPTQAATTTITAKSELIN